MKSGFYLSPCGKHIIEVTKDPINPVFGLYDVCGRPDGFDDFMFDCFVGDLSIILSCWHYLGE
jgi:hypothetical protein